MSLKRLIFPGRHPGSVDSEDVATRLDDPADTLVTPAASAAAVHRSIASDAERRTIHTIPEPDPTPAARTAGVSDAPVPRRRRTTAAATRRKDDLTPASHAVGAELRDGWRLATRMMNKVSKRVRIKRRGVDWLHVVGVCRPSRNRISQLRFLLTWY